MEADDKEIVKGICYETLPCRTNQTCKEVEELKDVISKMGVKYDEVGRTMNKIMGGLIIALILLVANLVVSAS